MSNDKEQSGEAAGHLAASFWDQTHHDLHQPVEALQLLTELFSRQVVDGEANRSINHMKRALATLTQMHSALIRLGHLTSGQTTAHPFPLRTVDVVREVLASFNGTAHMREFILQTDALPVWLNTDLQLLKSNLEGMIGFAVDQSEGRRISILGSTHDEADVLMVEFHAPNFIERRADQVFVEIANSDSAAREETIRLGPAYLREICRSIGQKLDFVPLEGGRWQARLTLPRNRT